VGLLVDFLRRLRSYRSSAFELSYVFALLVVFFFSSSRLRSLAERERPKVVAADSALAQLVRTLAPDSDAVDPRLTALAVKRRDLQTELNDRQSFWLNIRLLSSFGFMIAVVAGAVGFVQHMLSTESDENLRPPSIIRRRRDTE
jgi:hypothetical protein